MKTEDKKINKQNKKRQIKKEDKIERGKRAQQRRARGKMNTSCFHD